MVLTKVERHILQDIASSAVTYNNLVALAAQENHQCEFHAIQEACDIRDSIQENAQAALEEFNTAMSKLAPFEGCKLE